MGRRYTVDSMLVEDTKLSITEVYQIVCDAASDDEWARIDALEPGQCVQLNGGLTTVERTD